jgi:hypothetical protein
LHCMQLSHISERERDSRICIRWHFVWKHKSEDTKNIERLK